MSEQQYYVTLKQELQKLNTLIDSKIIQGKNYSFESRKHAMIREMINKSKKKKAIKFFSFLRA